MNDLDNILAEVQVEAQEPLPLSKEEFAAMKQGERDAVYALADQTALDVAGDGATFQKFLDLRTRLDRYSETNALLVMAQKPEASRVGSFEYWSNQGCSVMKDEKAISIIKLGKSYARSDGSVGMGYEVKKVFDISQVNVSKMEPTPPKPQPAERQLIKALVTHTPMKVDVVDELPGNLCAMYDAQADCLLVCRDKEFSESFKDIAQALAYADLTTGPDTQVDPHFSSACAAYMLCKKHGVDATDFKFDHAPDYLAGMDAIDIKGELSQIRDVSADISQRMARTLEPPSRETRTRDNGAR